MSLAYAALAAQHRGAPVPRSDDVETHSGGTLASSAHVKALFPGPPFCSTAMLISRPSVSDIPQFMKQESLAPFPSLCLPILFSARQLLHALQPCPRPCVTAILPGRYSVSESPPPTKHNSLASFPVFRLFCLASSCRSRGTSCEAGPFLCTSVCLSLRQHLGRAVLCYCLRLSPLRASAAIAARRPSRARLWPLAAAHASALPHDLPDSSVPFASRGERTYRSTPPMKRITRDAHRTREKPGMPQERQTHVVVTFPLSAHMTRAHARSSARKQRLLEDWHHVVNGLHHLPSAAPIALECAHSDKQGHVHALQQQRAGSLNGS